MPEEYRRPEDFATDDSFVNFCFNSRQEDVDFWENWLAMHPDKRHVAEMGRELVFLVSVRLPPERRQAEWEKLAAAAEPSPARQRGRKRWAWALTTAALALAGIVYFRGKPGAPSPQNPRVALQRYATPAGTQDSMRLPDGTLVRLNAGSQMTWHEGTGPAAPREVTLSGEAFFDVAPDVAHPFLIHTRALDIRVLGTSFNVKAYPGDQTVEASLIRGSIEVAFHKDPARRIVLKPHEKIIVREDSALSAAPSGDPQSRHAGDEPGAFTVAPMRPEPLLEGAPGETAWLDGKLVFRAEAFDGLAKQLERKYGVQIHFTDPSLLDYHFTGIFSTETLDQALHALQLTSPSAPFDYRISGKDIYIHRRVPSSP